MSSQTPLRWLGRSTLRFLDTATAVFTLLLAALVIVPLYVRGRGSQVVRRLTADQIFFTGVQALPVTAVASLALGTLLVHQANAYLPVEYAPSVAATILTRDVLPLVVAVIVIGRSGSAIAVQLANMRLTGELDALRAMGLPLEHYVVLPRLIAGVVSTAVLSVYALAVALVGGFLLSRLMAPLPFRLWALVDAVSGADLLLLLSKSILFGGAIVLVGIQVGFSSRLDSREIPQASTRSAVRSVLLCFIVNSILSLVF